MSGQQERVVTSLNEYVKQLPDDSHITVFKFDSMRWTKFFEDAKGEWKEMKLADYSPGAMTPLYDAIGKTIAHAESLAKDGDKVMVMIDTDGYENASQEHTLEAIKSKVEERKAKDWAFLFMASGLDTRAATQVGATGQALNMSTRATAHSGRVAAYASAGGQTQAYFAGDKNWSKTGTSTNSTLVNKDDDEDKDKKPSEPFFARSS